MFGKKLSLFHKLIVANIFYSLPVMGLVYLMVQAQNVNIEFGAQETVGNTLQRPLEKTLKSFLVLRSIVNQGFDPKEERLKDITATVADLKANLDKVGEKLLFTPAELEKRKRGQVAFEQFEKRWLNFATNYPRIKAEDRVTQATGFAADVRTMIAHMGDTSNLILDPDLDSYYLMDITLLALPQTQDRIAEVLGYMGGVAKRGGVPTDAEKVQLAVYSALLKQSDQDRITGDMQTVLNEDPNFYGPSPSLKEKLQPKITEYDAAMTAFIKTLDESYSSGKVSADFAKAGNRAFAASFDSWFSAVDELDVLLNKRIDDLSWHKYRDLGLSLAALMMAFGVLFWVSSNFNKNMREVLVELRNAVMRTKESGSGLVSLSQDLSEASTDQASALQETAASVEQINSMVQSTLSNTRVADGTAGESLNYANQGTNSVSSLITAIGDISHANDQILSQIEQNTQEMAEITKVIADIGSKTAVINDIVFQTKLLSFNASVEAARAGEHGKGFAVVAEEVGNLAQMSGNAAKEISSMLAGSISRVDAISGNNRQKVKSLLGEGRDKIQAGSNLADTCTKAINDILVRVTEVKSNVESIHAAADQQAQGISEITKAMHRLDQITQKNSHMSKQTAEQSRNLSDQADTLDAIVNRVQTEVLGARDAGPDDDSDYDSETHAANHEDDIAA